MARRRISEERSTEGKLINRTVSLHNMEMIAKYSFIVHKSINYLDLSLREFSSLKEKKKILIKIMFCLADPAYGKKFVSTVESCRKTLVFERRWLYTLHLDLPKDREEIFLSLSTRHIKEPKPRAFCFNELFVDDKIYEESFRRFIEMSLKQNGRDMNFVRRQIALMKCLLSAKKIENNSTDYFESDSTNDLILKCLYPACTDSEVIQEFLSILDFNSWVLSHYKPNVLEYLLTHAHSIGYNLKLNDREGILVNRCFFQSNFNYVELLLKYQNAPFYYDCGTRILYPSWTQNTRVFYAFREGIDWCVDYLDVPFKKGLMSKRRYLLWLQVFHAYPASNKFSVNGRNASWTLRLLWRSLPDALFTLDELTSAYQNVPTIIDITTKVHEFYVKAVGGDLVVSEPRTLQQYCRVTIRKSLCYNRKLPSGLKKLNLPRKLKIFIKLKK